MQPSDRPKGGAITREFSAGQTVTARNYTSSTKWVSGIIQTQLGPLSYEAAVKPGLVWHRHNRPTEGYQNFNDTKQQSCYPDLRTSNPVWPVWPLILLDDNQSECRSRQLSWIYELWSDIKTFLISIGLTCLISRFRSLLVTILHALAIGEELCCFWPVANTLWTCAVMHYSNTCPLESKTWQKRHWSTRT